MNDIEASRQLIQGDAINGESSNDSAGLSKPPITPEFVGNYVDSIQELNTNLSQIVRIYKEMETASS